MHVFRQEKAEEKLGDTCTPENKDGLDNNRVNIEVWRKLSHKTKVTAL